MVRLGCGCVRCVLACAASACAGTIHSIRGLRHEMQTFMTCVYGRTIWAHMLLDRCSIVWAGWLWFELPICTADETLLIKDDGDQGMLPAWERALRAHVAGEGFAPCGRAVLR